MKTRKTSQKKKERKKRKEIPVRFPNQANIPQYTSKRKALGQLKYFPHMQL